MGTIFDREHEPPEPTAGDAVHGVVRDLVSALPGAGQVLDHQYRRAPPPLFGERIGDRKRQPSVLADVRIPSSRIGVWRSTGSVTCG